MSGKGNRMPGFNSDFCIVGYSAETAMKSFINGDAAVTDGALFDISKNDSSCIISQELAAFNDLSVGDSISISNPDDEEELHKLTVSGIYSNSSANSESFSRFGTTSADPVNQILVSYKTMEKITASEISGTLAATYVFEDVDAYEAFEKEARKLGLDDTYVITSADIASFENSMTPLNTLSTIAGYFLLVILIIGAIILVVLNIFNVRERKYEIGVLTAMGMKKGKVALQFLTEIFVITLAAIIIGTGVGAASFVPVTNALLENQVASQTAQSEQIEQNFGRGQGDQMSPDNGKKFTDMRGMNQETDYVSEISSAMNLTVVLQLFAIGLILTLIASAVSMLFVMRYDPLKILANRD